MSTLVWIAIVVVYLSLFVALGLATLRKGHTALFIFGIFFPVLWIIGAVMQPTPAAAAAQPRTGLQ
jgi:hypothetical protein